MMSETISINIGWSLTTGESPVFPDAKRGAVYERTGPLAPRATLQQLDAGLIWASCCFCGAFVLIDAERRTRERCSCGAVRCHRNGADGWRRDGESWWMI